MDPLTYITILTGTMVPGAATHKVDNVSMSVGIKGAQPEHQPQSTVLGQGFEHNPKAKQHTQAEGWEAGRAG